MASTQDFPEVDKNTRSKMYIYKWFFEFYDSEDESNKVHPNKLIAIEETKDYSLVTPILTGSFRFSNYDIMMLSRMQKRCLCNIICKCDIYESIKGLPGSSNSGMGKYDSKIVFSSVFIPVFDPNTFKFKFSESDIEKAKDVQEISRPNNTAESPTRVVYITFFNLLAQNAMHTSFNQVINSGSTMGSILTWIASQLPVQKCIIDPPANSGELGYDLVIPPLNLIPTLKYLQTEHGIYENGITTWIDFDNCLYILDKYNYDHDREKGKTALTHLNITDIDETGPSNPLRTENQDGDGMYTGSINMKNVDAEVLEGELQGHSFVFSSFNQGFNAIRYDENNKFSEASDNIGTGLIRNTETHSASGDKIICDYDELNNPYNMASIFNESESKAKQFVANITSCNIDDFEVNKIIEVHFRNVDKNNKYGGKYYLNLAKMRFESLAASDYNMSTEEMEENKENGYQAFKTACSCSISISRRNPSKTTSE